MTVPDSASTLTEHLAKTPYLSVLSPAELDTLVRDSVHFIFSPDEVIFLEGDPSRGLWIIEDGSVKITKLGTEGNEYILHLLGPGDTFNDIATLSGGPTPANAISMSLVSAWLLPSDAMDRALDRYPAIGRAALKMMGARIRALGHQIEDLTLYPVMVRLARFLLTQAENPSLSGPGVTRAAIAAHLATTPESLSRALAKLQDTGTIRFDRHNIIIVNVDLLRSVAVL
ncbi:MAG TPA: Crp/Fnr family transcriptional regulator [Aggregatilinea sp.]|uniref:Crp/Fnr family transcriptional regulator n=1 Tax=Aggregatilinea sp. TaxID=2806333 RepID=UPI002C4E8373|nr:Crp/Fnr family transcriptional regulator [Aggregatilinea sp.]HML20252.1 Crp/Fnr family transcriptional regulator [Aggregatilinea sp.]